MKQKNVNNNVFNTWNPIAYLQEYFPSGVDIEPVVKLIADEGKKRLSPNALAIDVGCGPTVCYWSALASHAKELHLADYLDVNLEQIKLWLDADKNMYDWSYYTEMILKFEGLQSPSREEIFRREALSRSRVTKILHCDISKSNPVGASGRRKYDCVISVCVADSITTSKNEWAQYMKNIFSLLKPGGVFMGSAMRNCTHYDIGDISYPAANVNEIDFKNLLIDYGFEDIRVEVTNESRPIIDLHSNKVVDLRGEYDQVILAVGTLSSKE